MSSDGTEADANTPDPASQPNLQVVGQYIKDLSFENPGAPAGLTARPKIDFGVDLQARPLAEDHYEVMLHIRISATTAEDKPLFLLELAYAGLFQLFNIPAEAVQQVLMIQAPHLLFPFARRIIADVVRDGGMPPLMIEPIDFVSLYRARLAKATQPTAEA